MILDNNVRSFSSSSIIRIVFNSNICVLAKIEEEKQRNKACPELVEGEQRDKKSGSDRQGYSHFGHSSVSYFSVFTA
jgi:hypothetical protein